MLSSHFGWIKIRENLQKRLPQVCAVSFIQPKITNKPYTIIEDFVFKSLTCWMQAIHISTSDIQSAFTLLFSSVSSKFPGSFRNVDRRVALFTLYENSWTEIFSFQYTKRIFVWQYQLSVLTRLHRKLLRGKFLSRQRHYTQMFLTAVSFCLYSVKSVTVISPLVLYQYIYFESTNSPPLPTTRHSAPPSSS